MYTAAGHHGMEWCFHALAITFVLFWKLTLTECSQSAAGRELTSRTVCGLQHKDVYSQATKCGHLMLLITITLLAIVLAIVHKSARSVYTLVLLVWIYKFSDYVYNPPLRRGVFVHQDTCLFWDQVEDMMWFAWPCDCSTHPVITLFLSLIWQ